MRRAVANQALRKTIASALEKMYHSERILRRCRKTRQEGPSVPEFFQKLFAKDFMPHGMCYYWDPAVLWVNVISDSLIAAAYYATRFLVFYFVTKRRDV